MKPKDLKILTTWEERKPLLKDNVFLVPPHYDNHTTLPPWQDIFGNTNPIHIEYCSGNGEWIAKKAAEHPECNWIAVEKQFPRVQKIWSKSQNRQLKNLFIICGYAQDFTQHYLTKPCISQIYVNFPDPWPKKRHAKHRLIQTPFIDLITKICLPNAEAHFVTDDLAYANQMEEVMQAHPQWEETRSILTESHGPSFFDRLWRSKGRTIHTITSRLI